MSPGSNRRAFTLVELLVVIGIIAVLISVLLPALGRARDSAKQTACASNLRQVSLAMLVYINDNRGKFPRAYSGIDGSYSWHSLLVGLKYIQAPTETVAVVAPPDEDYTLTNNLRSILMCPETLSGARTPWGWPTQTWSNAAYGLPWRFSDTTGYAGLPDPLIVDTSYAINAAQGDWTAIGNRSGNAFLSQFSTAHRLNVSRRISDVRRASDLMMFADGWNWKFGAYPTAVNPRHGGASKVDGGKRLANYAFFDGHVEAFDPRAFFIATDTWAPSRKVRKEKPVFRLQDLR